ncbi:hypothetical protein CYJ29_06390 [Aerococcus loyolae]|uniref:CtkA family protein n=1 Tax=Aerococcus urinae TaxID=1376 RepID=A0A2I1L666_9LACT|nr:CtkA family protein [Aerococcus loyolae]PKY84892.1 hypothetical protein CYJ30_06105 [Aerococcus loyolae]PKZ03369.1 hypothetical protein CYJ29_06390 [Aerococcus loyolae]RAV68592.1 CtkA family protein [Aerococcus loyolae]RAV80591.1 CtkA family protein [Aerococcus loyolae]
MPVSVLDFTKCEVDPTRIYGGRNGNKIGIIYQGVTWMLKFPVISKLNPYMHYSNSNISEYLGCHIVNILGLEAQETLLAYYGNQEVVACKDFEQNDKVFKEFAFLKNSIVDSSQSGYGTELSDILTSIDEQELINPERLRKFFWHLFIIDTYIGNFDRHNANWGFLINQRTRQVEIAPVFDCGSSLYPQTDEKSMAEFLKDSSLRDKRIYKYPNSAIKIDDVKINYLTFLSNTKNQDCIRALETIYERINQKESLINHLIDKTPLMTETHKSFIQVMLKERKEKILEKALSYH